MLLPDIFGQQRLHVQHHFKKGRCFTQLPNLPDSAKQLILFSPKIIPALEQNIQTLFCQHGPLILPGSPMDLDVRHDSVTIGVEFGQLSNGSSASVDLRVAGERILVGKLTKKTGTVPGVFEPRGLTVEGVVKPGEGPNLLGMHTYKLIALNGRTGVGQKIKIASALVIPAVFEPERHNLPEQSLLIYSGEFLKIEHGIKIGTGIKRIERNKTDFLIIYPFYSAQSVFLSG
jgi:hypothetical protein